MPLGIELNNIAPQLIQNSGAALVQGIRQIGQQISGHLTELQTKRDLGAMAQEMQGLNVQSDQFPVQLSQMLFRHPLAAKDERAKMPLISLGEAHGAWKAGEAEARAFNRAMATQTRRKLDAREEYDYESGKKLETPQNIGGALVIPRDPVTGQPNVLVPAPNRQSGPRVLNQGDIMFDPSGKKLAENPKPVAGLTPGQAVTDARLAKKNKIDLLMRQDRQLQADVNAALKRRDDLTTEKFKLGKDGDSTYFDNTIKAIESEHAELQKRRSAVQKAIEDIESAPAEVDDVGVLPAPGAVVATDEPNALVPVINPSGKATNLKRSQVEAALQHGYKLR